MHLVPTRAGFLVAHTFDAVAKQFQDTAYYANSAWVASHRDLVGPSGLRPGR
jgi:hypothetical protein